MMCPWCYAVLSHGAVQCGRCHRAVAPSHGSHAQTGHAQTGHAQTGHAQTGHAQTGHAQTGHAQPRQAHASQAHGYASASYAGQPSSGPQPRAKKKSSALWFGVFGLLSLLLIGGIVLGVYAYGGIGDGDSPTSLSGARGLKDLAKKKMGPFQRVSAKKNKKTKAGITDALKTKYKRDEGENLSYDLFACASPKRAKKTYASLVDKAKDKLADDRVVMERADIQDPDGNKIGELSRFVSDVEIIVWYEPELAAVIEGNYDDALEFMRACPYCPEWSAVDTPEE